MFCSDSVHYYRFKSKLFNNKQSYYHNNAKNMSYTRLLSPINKSSKFSSQALIIIPITTFCLGCWQVYRRQWKLNLINELEMRTKQQAIDLPDNLEDVRDLEYRKVRVKGTFDHSKEVYITPRSLISDRKAKNRQTSTIFTSQNATAFGYLVVTPFNLSQSGKRILVNRGWVPRFAVDPKLRPNGQIESEIELTGVLRNTEKRSPFGMKNDEDNNRWSYRDNEAMAAKLNTEPIFIDADFSATIAGGPIGGQTLVNLRNEHLSYIITWFGLCAVTLYLWYIKNYKRKRLI